MRRYLAMSFAIAAACGLSSTGASAAPRSAGFTAYTQAAAHTLPDPQGPFAALLPATQAQIDAAYAINASLDLWRVCSWTGHEAAAAVFVDWARTHTVGDTMAPASLKPVRAWKSFGVISAARTSLPDTGFNTAPGRCDVTRATRARLQADMERYATDLNW
jgi:hypothetical protein